MGLGRRRRSGCPTSGAATIFGLHCRKEGVAVRKRVGYLPGELNLDVGMKASTFLDLVAALHGHGVDPEYRRDLCRRLDLNTTRRIGEYSRGNKQKIGIVAAFMVRPDLLILDEPTSGLDPLVQQAVPIIVAFMMISLFLGSFLPTRRSAAMAATVIFIASYFGERFTTLAKSLRPISRWSLFHYFDSTATLFTEGVKSRDLILLLTTGAVFFVLSLVCFLRRDVTTHAWPWRSRISARRRTRSAQA